MIEKLELARLRPHLLASNNFCPFQSAYRIGHSAKTALLELFGSIYKAGDHKLFTVVIGLYLSAAFDTVNHSILIDRLQQEFGVTSTALQWLASYLSNRSQFIKIGHHSSVLPTAHLVYSSGTIVIRGIWIPCRRCNTWPCREVSSICRWYSAVSVNECQLYCRSGNVGFIHNCTEAVVPTKRPPVECRQIWCDSSRNSTPATCSSRQWHQKHHRSRYRIDLFNTRVSLWKTKMLKAECALGLIAV